MGHRADARCRRRHVAQLTAGFDVSRAGAILAVANVDHSLAFYRDVLGFSVDAVFGDPPYAILSRAGMRLSLAEQGYAAEDRPGVLMTGPEDPARAAVVLVLEVEDCVAANDELAGKGADFLAPPYSPPWGGHRFFVRDPDGSLPKASSVSEWSSHSAQARPSDLESWRPRQPAAEAPPAFLWAVELAAAATAPPPALAAEEWDEVDEFFRGGK